jgi:outer membrane protein
MNCLVFLATALLAATAAAQQPPRFAIVRVKEIYRDLPSTQVMQEEVRTAQENILRDPRAEQFRQLIGELETLQSRLQDRNNPLDDEARRDLARTYELKRQEAQTMQQEFENFRTERTREINQKMVSSMRGSLQRITEAAQRLGRERGFDAVFDSSGETNTGLPLLLYVKDAPDLTADVVAALDDDDKAAVEPAEAGP